MTRNGWCLMLVSGCTCCCVARAVGRPTKQRGRGMVHIRSRPCTLSKPQPPGPIPATIAHQSRRSAFAAPACLHRLFGRFARSVRTATIIFILSALHAPADAATSMEPVPGSASHATLAVRPFRRATIPPPTAADSLPGELSAVSLEAATTALPQAVTVMVRCTGALWRPVESRQNCRPKCPSRS